MKKLIAISACLILFGAGCTAANTTQSVNINFDQNAAAPFTPAINNNSPVTNENAPMKTWPSPTILPESELTNKEAVIETNKGTIVFDLLTDSPLAESNFITLAKGGFYDGLTFHRVVADFVIQGGDPAGDGTGGPGYHFAIEPVKRAYEPGTVAMARTDEPNSNGSQFFIVLPGGEAKLGPLYTIFGQVVKGMDVVEKIAVGDIMTKITIQDKK